MYLLESSQYECLVRTESAVVSMGCGPLVGGWWPLFGFAEDVSVGGGSVFVRLSVFSQMEDVSHATRFAIVHDRAEPCLTPQ